MFFCYFNHQVALFRWYIIREVEGIRITIHEGTDRDPTLLSALKVEDCLVSNICNECIIIFVWEFCLKLKFQVSLSEACNTLLSEAFKPEEKEDRGVLSA